MVTACMLATQACCAPEVGGPPRVRHQQYFRPCSSSQVRCYSPVPIGTGVLSLTNSYMTSSELHRKIFASNARVQKSNHAFMYSHVDGEMSLPSAHSCMTGHWPHGIDVSGDVEGSFMIRFTNTGSSSSPTCSSICRELQQCK